MLTLLIAIGSFVGFIVAYNTYGRWLAQKIFDIDPEAEVPSRQLRDDVDFVPTRKEVIFGHHFTSIAGTGPIVGPAIAVFWGWLPALLWVVFGSIFIGAVHDFGALVVSLRNRGQTVGEIAGRIIAPRAKVLFLLVLFFALTVVLAIFGLVIASIFNLYPESVLSVWLAMPLAVAVGFWVYRGGGSLLLPSVIALLLLYAAIYIGAEYVPLVIPAAWCNAMGETLGLGKEALNPIVVWTTILFGYCFVASVLPVWVLLQPRDFINSQQLIVALGLLVLSIGVAGATGQVDLAASAPAVVPAANRPLDAPPIWPFLFITIACGAISGFHCLVSSGTTSKQLANEGHAQYVAFGSMLMEGALAVIVILACCAGIGMGLFERRLVNAAPDGWIRPYEYVQQHTGGTPLTGRDAWRNKYDQSQGWKKFRLGEKVGSFVDGGANFLTVLGLPLKFAVAAIAVLVACFAATTLDTATRLQRYVVQELASTLYIRPLTNKYAATLLAVSLALALAMMRGPDPAPGQLAPHGTGGQYLWPLFGATNQLLAGIAFLVTAFYLHRRNKPIWFILIPMLLMIGMPVWAMGWQMFNPESGWWPQQNYLLGTIGGAVVFLQLWMVAEAILAWPRAKGVLEEELPPLSTHGHDPQVASGRSC
ncbi:MAG: carbon starvation protein A [Pirellulales bacterium]|nr:carbon starvation protein A [Pirellulales bacterium]